MLFAKAVAGFLNEFEVTFPIREAGRQAMMFDVPQDFDQTLPPMYRRKLGHYLLAMDVISIICLSFRPRPAPAWAMLNRVAAVQMFDMPYPKQAIVALGYPDGPWPFDKD